MNTKELYDWLETCPTHKWEVNDEFGDIGAGYITVSFPTQEEDLTESDFIATIFDEYGAGVWSRDADLRTAVQDAAKRVPHGFCRYLPPTAGLYLSGFCLRRPRPRTRLRRRNRGALRRHQATYSGAQGD
jgi:hypothetical protein